MKDDPEWGYEIKTKFKIFVLTQTRPHLRDVFSEDATSQRRKSLWAPLLAQSQDASDFTSASLKVGCLKTKPSLSKISGLISLLASSTSLPSSPKINLITPVVR